MGFFEDWDRESTYSKASGKELPYVVLQVTLKEKFLGTGSGNLEDLEEVINNQCKKGYRLFSFSTTNGGSKGFAGGDRIQATLIFERIDLMGTYFEHNIKQGNPNVNTELEQWKTQFEVKEDTNRTTGYTVVSNYKIRCDNCGKEQTSNRLSNQCGVCFYCGSKFTTSPSENKE